MPNTAFAGACVTAQFCDIALAKVEGFLQLVACFLKVQFGFVKFKCALRTYFVLISLQAVNDMTSTRRDYGANFFDIVATRILLTFGYAPSVSEELYSSYPFVHMRSLTE